MKGRWGSAEGALAALTELKRLTQSQTHGDTPARVSAAFKPFLNDFGPDLCKQYHLLLPTDPISEVVVAPPSTSRDPRTSIDLFGHNQSSELQSISAEHADPMLSALSKPFYSDLDSFGSWMDVLGPDLAPY